jgi:hypothetical protein
VHVVGDPERLRVRGQVEPAEVPTEVDSVPLDLLADLVNGAVNGARGMHRDDLAAAARAGRTVKRAEPELSAGELTHLLGRRMARRLKGR